MNRRSAAGMLSCAFLGGLVFLVSCAVPPVKIMPFAGVTQYPPTDPAAITVLQTTPGRSHQTLGHVVLVPDDPLAPEEVDLLLRQAAGSMGADAVIMLANMNMVSGANSAQLWGGHVVSAVAIRYTDESGETTSHPDLSPPSSERSP